MFKSQISNFQNNSLSTIISDPAGIKDSSLQNILFAIPTYILYLVLSVPCGIEGRNSISPFLSVLGCLPDFGPTLPSLFVAFCFSSPNNSGSFWIILLFLYSGLHSTATLLLSLFFSYVCLNQFHRFLLISSNFFKKPAISVIASF